ncbi:MAG: site-specific DNA-methyltransferase [Candidatus Staskawiczbacteria bacterium]|nr:site-specific DNA-methyltransferase [Candidatus Staskawiczbacteria bacterium]
MDNERNSEIFKLQKEIDRLKKSIKKQRYGLVWMDIPEAFEDDVENKLPILKEVPDLAIKTEDGKPQHILIEGDNYHALTCLNYTHKGKIDVIYIDPPYNTGSDGFRYKDKRTIDKFPDGSEVPKDHPFRHSYWLSFMRKRLELAKELLSEKGLICISIDDNEQAQLKLLCNEIFGELNLLDTFYIQVRYAEKSLNEKDDFQKLIEQVLIYAKDKKRFIPNKPSEEYDLNKFKYEIKENKPGKRIVLGKKKVTIFKPGEYEIIEKKPSIDLLKATWASGSVLKGNTSGKFFHLYLEPRKKEDGLGVLYKVDGIGEDGIGYRYFTGPKQEKATKGLFYSGVPNIRREEIEKDGSSQKERTIINYYDFSGDFGNIRHEGGVDFRSGKKPTKMLKLLINLHKGKNIKVLDFFAGSGSSAHATLLLNEDGGTRQFIICTNNEDNICSTCTYPRMKNIMRGLNGVESLGNSLKYYKTEFIGKNNILSTTDEDKIELAHNAGELLAIAENTLESVKQNKYYQLFEDNNKEKYTAVYFREELDQFDKFVEMVEKLNKKTIVYVFSWGNDEFIDEFENLKNVKVKTIPLPILEIYKNIYNLEN